MTMLWHIALLAIAPPSGCVQLGGEVIHARDLSPEVAAFAAANPETILGPAPVPGVRRWFSLRDLIRAARQAAVSGTDLPAGGVCVERELRELSEPELIAAMTPAFPSREVRIAIVDHSRYGVPAGRLVFNISGLNTPPPGEPDAPVLWRGRLLFDGNRSVGIWAKVRIRETASSCVAVTDIQPGKPIERDQVRIADLARFPVGRSRTIDKPEDAIGMVARRRIRAGEGITAELIEAPREINAGDKVRVVVVSGNARIAVDAIAVAGGRRGETIMLRNPSTRAIYRAVVDGSDRAIVVARAGGEGS